MFEYKDDFGKNLYDLKIYNYENFVEYLYKIMETKDASEKKSCEKRIKRILKHGMVANADIAYIVKRDHSTIDSWIHDVSFEENNGIPAHGDVVPVIAEAFGVSADFLVGLDDYYEETDNEEQQISTQGTKPYCASVAIEKIKSGISEILEAQGIESKDIDIVNRNVSRIFYLPNFLIKLSHYLDKSVKITTVTPIDKKILKAKILNTLDESPQLLKSKLDDILSDNQLSSNMIKEIYIADLVQELKKLL